jgi:hypothetical protein
MYCAERAVRNVDASFQPVVPRNTLASRATGRLENATHHLESKREASFEIRHAFRPLSGAKERANHYPRSSEWFSGCCCVQALVSSWRRSM